MNHLKLYLIVFLLLSTFTVTHALTTTNCDTERCRINNGDFLDITVSDCEECKKVTNNTGGHIFIPIKTCNEWRSFLIERANRDNISVESCVQIHATPVVTFDTPTYGINQTLSWTRISTASGGYRVEIQRDGGTWTVYNSNVSQPASGTTVSLTIPSSEFNSMGTRRFRVRANAVGPYPVGEWGLSPTRTIQKANQSAPSAPTCSSSTQSSVTISSCAGCEYRRATGSAQSSNTFTGLSADTAYTFSRRLAETTTHNASAWSSNVSCRTSAAVPTTPTGVTCSAVSTSQINVSWNAVSGATGYYIYRCTGSGCTPSSHVHTTSGTSWSNTGLSSGTTYGYRVRAYNASGTSGYSSITSCTTQSAVPATPTGVTCSAVSSSQINVSWNAVSGATGYYIYRCTGSGCTPSSHVHTTSGTSWSDTSLSSGTTYGYRVRAYNASGTSSYSSITSCTTQSAASGSLSFSSSTQNSITLYYSYSNGTNVSLFVGNSYWANLGSGNNWNYYTVSGLSSGSYYNFYLRNGTSSSSPLLASTSGSTQAATASGSLSCPSSTQNSITLYYSYSNGTNVSLFRDSSYLSNLGSGNNWNYYTVSGLSSGSYYNFYLRNGTSSSSPLLSSVSCNTQSGGGGGSCSPPYSHCSRRIDCNHCLTNLGIGCYTYTCCLGDGPSSYCIYGPNSAPCCCCK